MLRVEAEELSHAVDPLQAGKVTRKSDMSDMSCSVAQWMPDSLQRLSKQENTATLPQVSTSPGGYMLQGQRYYRML